MKASSIIIQNVIYPYFVAVNILNEKTGVQKWQIQSINRNFNEVIDNLNRQMDMSFVAKVFVNVGPGSYTGIRQGVAFTLGFAVARGKVQVFQFTSFDLVLFAGRKDLARVFIQGLPPIEAEIKSKEGASNEASGISTLKGWLGVKQLKGWDVVYSNLGNIPKGALVYSSSSYTSPQFEWINPLFLHINEEFLERFVRYLLDKRDIILIKDINKLMPLYVNPVKITNQQK